MRSLHVLRPEAAEQVRPLANEITTRVAIACDEVWRRYRSGSQRSSPWPGRLRCAPAPWWR